MGGIITALILNSRARTATLLAAANLVEDWHKRDIKRKKDQLEVLKRNFEGNAKKIEKLEVKIEAKRAKLTEKFQAKGLSSNEMARRFTDLGF